MSSNNINSIDPINIAWNDLRTPINAIRLAGAQPPTATAYKGGYVLSFPSNTNTTVYFNFQMDHSYKFETDLDFHIHYVIPTAGAGGGAENVKWDFTYTWFEIDAAISDATSASQTIDVQAKSANTHYYSDIVTISGTGKDSVSSILICSLTRDTSVANNYADDVYLLSLDIHYNRDSVGSREETTK